ncbi:MAG: efflux RND transporter periplasmic adaptor subunit [Bacillota bacterium]
MRKLVVIVMIAVLSLMLVGCSGQQQAEVSQSIRPVRYQQITKSKNTIERTFSGRLRPSISSRLSFRIAGQIDQILVDLGDQVEEGELLAVLDQSDYRLQVKSAAANLKQAEARMESSRSRVAQAKQKLAQMKSKVAQAKSGIASAEAKVVEAAANYERSRQLYQNDNISKSAYDKARSAHQTAQSKLEEAQARLTEAKAGREEAEAALKGAKQEVKSAEEAVGGYQKQLELAKLKLSYTKLRAPKAGSIVMQNHEVNENVAAGTPVLLLSSGQNLEVELSVAETAISKINQGDTVEISVSALDRQQIKGRVTEVGDAAVDQEVTYPVKVTLTENISELRAGMTAEAKFEFELSADNSRLIVPATAVGGDQQGNFLYLIKDVQNNRGTVKKVRVQTGSMSAEGITIKSGLEAGELVVTAGISKLTDGQQVKLSNKGKEERE